MSTQYFRIGDRGTEFRVTITDSVTGAVEPVPTATTIKFAWKKPDGTTVSKDGEFYTDGTDGIVKYVVDDEAFFDVKGKWKMQVFVIVTGGQWYTEKDEFEVEENIINFHLLD